MEFKGSGKSTSGKIRRKDLKMIMKELKQKARRLNIKPGKTRKTDLIHRIQQAEGFQAYFGKLDGQCGQLDCCFRDDCMKVKR